MLVLGVVLIIFGALLAYFGRRSGAEVAFWGGVLIFAGGAVLFVIAILDVSGADTAAMVGVSAMAIVPPHIHGPHDHDPSIPVAGSTADRQPVLVAFAVAAVPIACAFILQVFDAAGLLDSALWLRTLLTGLGGVTGALAAAWARSRVTPTALPRLDDRTPLVPMVESEQT